MGLREYTSRLSQLTYGGRLAASLRCGMEDPVTASVVICAYTMDRWPVLMESVASARAQTHQPTEVILVIDHNEELSQLANAHFHGVTVLANECSPGIAGARNAGCAVASGSVLAFLDDDAIAEPEWLERLVSHYASAGVLGVGGLVLPDWRSGKPDWFPAEFNWVVGCSWTGLPDTLAEVRNPIGANFSVRREVHAAVGGFHSEMGHVAGTHGAPVTGTADETEFCIRASKHCPGGRWLYAPDAKVHHVVAQSRLSWAFFVGRCRMEGDSKATLTRIAGAERSLESERRYLRTVLPLAVVRELVAALGGDGAALRRGAAIISGLAITASSYVRRRVQMALWRDRG
jgi:GT2 family glycosyltransferase